MSLLSFDRVTFCHRPPRRRCRALASHRVGAGGEDLAKEGREGGRVDGVGENPAPCAGVGHGGAGQAKQRRQGGCPQARPIGNGFDPAVASEFGEDGNGEQRREQIADTARVALIDEVRELGG